MGYLGKNKKYLLAALLIMVLVSGTSALAAEVLDLWAGSIGTAPLGMGAAAVADYQGVFAPAWNPAGLAAMSGVGLGSQYSSLFGEVSRFGFAYGMPFLGGGLGIGYVNESLAGIPLTEIDPATGRPVLKGTFSENTQAAGLSYARTVFFNGLSAGGTARFLNKNLYDQKASCYSLDAGMIYDFNGSDFQFGLVARNILRSALRWNSGNEEYLSRSIAAGLGYKGLIWQSPVKLEADTDIIKSGGRQWRLGGEVWLAEMLALRIGSDGGNFTSGVGIKTGNFIIDYAYAGQADLGAIHQVSLEVKF